MEIDLIYLEQEFAIRHGIVIHAGANMCQERLLYEESDFGPIYWVEAIPKYVELSKQNLFHFKKQSIVEAALWSESGVEKDFHISSNHGLSSSLFKMKWHRALQPAISLKEYLRVSTISIDDLTRNLRVSGEQVSLLVLDLQGAELEALKGARETLRNTLSIHCEVSRIQLYESQPTFKDIDEFLTSVGFSLVRHDLEGDNYSGDALYVRGDLITAKTYCSVPENMASVRLNVRGWVKYRLVQIGVPARLLKRAKK
jgi:FkbM family methyltransferase